MLQWIRREFCHVFPIFLFFLIAFTLINFTEREFFRKAGMTPFTFLDVLIAAALVAKVLLVIDHLPWINLQKPLLHNILWKTAVYWLILVLVRLGIRFFPFLFEKDGLRAEFDHFIAAVDWRLFASIQTWYLMLFFLFVTGRELTSALGAKKMRQLFLGK